MILKRLPEDFLVEELPLVRPERSGPFTLYRLTKRGVGTLEALEAIRRRWNIEAARMNHGGLKDRHALTIQYLTIHDGPNRSLRQTNFDLEPIGKARRPYGPGCFEGNRFAMIIRDLSPEELADALSAIEQIPVDGLPNYFDDQRFGSVGSGGEFIARAWIDGNHERAFWLAIAEPNSHDRPNTRTEKEIVRACWGDWPRAKKELERSHTRSLVTYLVDHPLDFRGAFVRIRRDLRSLYFSAFQSHLWNLIAAKLINQETDASQKTSIAFRVASLPMHHGLDLPRAGLLRGARIPLPASRTPLPEGAMRELCLSAIDELGLAWDGLRVRGIKDVFFSKGDRAAIFHPQGLTLDHQPDDLHPGRRKLRLGFRLGRGSYATMFVKRLTMRSEAAFAEDEEIDS